jgi:hypothetical protein
MSQQTAREQLDWAREQDTMNRDLLNQVLDVQLPAMQEQFQTARADRQRYEEMFRPFEDQWAEEAKNYDTPERRAMERSRAMSDVSQQFDAQRQNALSRLENYGVDPSQTRNAALDVGVRTAQAAAAAHAATGADRRVEDTGRALESDVINLGRGALSNAAGFYGQAVGAGSAAQGNALNTTASGAGAVQSGLGFGSQALQGYGQGANIMSQGYGNQMAGWQAGQQQTAGMMGAVGGLAGMFMADGGEVEPSTGMVPGAPTPYMGDSELIDTGQGDGSGIDDNVPAVLSDGEYVIPADVVRKKGEEFFDKLIEKYHTPAAQQRQGAI